MNALVNEASKRNPRAEVGSTRPWVLAGVASLALLVVAIAWLRLRPGPATEPTPTTNAHAAMKATVPTTAAADNATVSNPTPAVAEVPSPAATPAVGPAPATASESTPTESAPGASPLPEPTPYSRDLVNSLIGVRPLTAGMSGEEVAQWKQNLQLLAQQGPAGVSAIREFLRQNQDVDFGGKGWDVLGYPSVRAAMFAALEQIGGPEAQAVALETLQTTADPREVALLSKSLETQAPEQHRAEILAATRDSLALAAKGQLEGRDVGPLFEVFEKYGGADTVADLELAAKQWNYYAVLTLGQLPDGAGVPSLIKMATDPGGPRIQALEVLASLSTRNVDAREALLEQVRANKITSSNWPYLAQALTGDETQVADSVFDHVVGRSTGEGIKTTHIRSGNQNIYQMPTIDTLTPDQLNQQVALIDEFIKVAESNPAAVEALQRSRSLLERRLGRAQAAVEAQSSGQ